MRGSRGNGKGSDVPSLLLVLRRPAARAPLGRHGRRDSGRLGSGGCAEGHVAVSCGAFVVEARAGDVPYAARQKIGSVRNDVEEGKGERERERTKKAAQQR